MLVRQECEEFITKGIHRMNKEQLLAREDGKSLCNYEGRFLHNDDEHENESEEMTQKEWLLANIPFIETPDQALDEVYYFRWRNILENLGKRRSDGKFEMTEGGPGVNYHKYIDCAQGAHILDARWIADPRYLNDYLDITPDYVAYKEWIIHSVWQKYLLDGDKQCIAQTYAKWKSRLDSLNRMYDEETGLYHVSGGGEGQEFGVNCFDRMEDFSVYRASYTDADSTLDALHDNLTADGCCWSNLDSPHPSDTVTITLPKHSMLVTGVKLWFGSRSRSHAFRMYITEESSRRQIGFDFTREDGLFTEALCARVPAEEVVLEFGAGTVVNELILEYDIEPAYSSDWFDACGGYESYRVGFNAYTCAGFDALSKMAALQGLAEEAELYHQKYARLKETILSRLWDEKQDFFVEYLRDPRRFSIGCELGGFAPWAFELIPDDPHYARAWKHMTEEGGFLCSYGLTSLEQKSPHFMQRMNHGCLWNGPVWPLVFSLTLKAMANTLEKHANPYISWDLFYELLCRYTNCHYDPDGSLAIREDHHPEENHWIAMAANYNHSTYVDLILSGLFGIVPTEKGLRICPHVPSAWRHFSVQDLTYRGHKFSIRYDAEEEEQKRYTVLCDNHPVFCSSSPEEYLYIP